MTTMQTPGFVDIHHHIVYGVDDGPQTVEQSRQMLALAYADGTRQIIATPHFDPVGKCPNVALLKQRLAELNAICAAEFPGLNIHLGAEVLFGEGIRRKLRAGIIPTLAGSSFVLVEFVPSVTREHLENAIRHLTNGGFVTILAHSERYPAITRDIFFVQYLKEKYGVLIQVNADTFLVKQHFKMRRFLTKSLQLGIIDFVASDAHGIKQRFSRMNSAYVKISAEHDATFVNSLFFQNAIMTCPPILVPVSELVEI